MNYLKLYFSSIIILAVLSSNILIKNSKPIPPISSNIKAEIYNISANTNFVWPTPGYNRVTSKFGKRKAPTKGASNSHSGIDIAAPPGSNILAISDGIVTYLGFKGAGGFTITTKNERYQISYCHVSPNFIVNIGDKISKGSVISNVGPYNVYGIPDNPYKDSSGRPINGASTGPHLHITIKENGTLINPLSLFFDK